MNSCALWNCSTFDGILFTAIAAQKIESDIGRNGLMLRAGATNLQDFGLPPTPKDFAILEIANN